MNAQEVLSRTWMHMPHMYLHMYLYMPRTHTHIHTHMHTHIHTPASEQTLCHFNFTYVCMYMCIYKYVCIHVYVYMGEGSLVMSALARIKVCLGGIIHNK
jgi:hypothetical protein